MGCLPCIQAAPAGNVYETAEKFKALKDEAVLSMDPPIDRSTLSLDAAGYQGLLGWHTPGVEGILTGPVTVVTAGGTLGGTAGPMHFKEPHLKLDSAGLYNEMARNLPAKGISVLQIAYRRPGTHRFDECISEVSRAAKLASDKGHVILVGHSMGGAVVLAASVKGPRKERVLGVCPLAPQTRGIPRVEDLRALNESGLLMIHGMADTILPPVCSQDIWDRLVKASGGDVDDNRSMLQSGEDSPSEYQEAYHRRLVLLEGAGHNLQERAEDVIRLVHDWVEILCRPLRIDQGGDGASSPEDKSPRAE